MATIEPGDVVSYPDTWFHWGNEAKFGMTFAEREPLRHRYPNGPYSMVGPVEVAGAEPGDAIECSLVSLRTKDWGWNSFPLGVGALPSDFAEPYVHYFRFDDSRRTTEYVQGITLALAPFLGVMALEPVGDASVSAILAGPYGGNLVLRELTVGSSLFLPVAKPGGRAWMGDVHALEGDGVVDQTAIETAAEDLQIRYDLHKGLRPAGPVGRDADALGRPRVCRHPGRRSRRLPARAHQLAACRGGHFQSRGLRPLEHGRKLSRHPIRPPDQLRLHLDPAEDRPRARAEERVPRDVAGAHRVVPAPGA